MRAHAPAEWTEPEPGNGNGSLAEYRSSALHARLLFDCHGEARRLDVDFAHGTPPDLLEFLRPFARAVEIAPGALSIVDRDGAFRACVVPQGVRVVLRKAAPPHVVASLMSQLERATHANSDAAKLGQDIAACTAGALSQASPGRLHVDETRCTRCLDCVQPHVLATHLPPVAPTRTGEDGSSP